MILQYVTNHRRIIREEAAALRQAGARQARRLLGFLATRHCVLVGATCSVPNAGPRFSVLPGALAKPPMPTALRRFWRDGLDGCWGGRRPGASDRSSAHFPGAAV